jgi:hypothetical protein
MYVCNEYVPPSCMSTFKLAPPKMDDGVHYGAGVLVAHMRANPSQVQVARQRSA